MNVGGVPNTCKSNGDYFVVIQINYSGERVSNALVICLEVWNNAPKGTLIPHVLSVFRKLRVKDLFASRGACVPSASW